MSDLENQLILITGASGYMAAHVVASLLSAGYSVRGTVRSVSTAEKVRKTFPQYASQLSFAIVEYVGKTGAFDTAVKGVDGVVHTAIPYQLDGQYARPAEACCQQDFEHPRFCFQTPLQVKRIIFTSSFVTLIDIAKGRWPGHVYSEEDWNPATYEAAAAKDAPGPLAYTTAKTVTERAAWDFVKTKNPHSDIATILPPMIYGPSINATASLASLNSSSADIYHLMSPGVRPSDTVPKTTSFRSWTSAMSPKRISCLQCF